MFGKSVVARIVSRHSHDGAGAVAGQYVFGNPDGVLLTREGVDGVAAGEDARDFVVDHAFAFGAAFDVFHVFSHSFALIFCCQLFYQFAFWCQHHEGDAEHRVGTGGEDGERGVGVGHAEFHFRALRASDPVALGLLNAVAPVDGVQAVEQTLGISRHAQTPLAHLLLFHGIAAAFAHAVDHLVVGQHGAELRTPVDHRFAQEGQSVLHQQVALLLFVGGPATFGFELLYEFLNGLCLLKLLVEVGVEHLLEGPLRPMVVVGRTSAHLAVPIETEADLVQLLAVAVDVGKGGLLRVLSRLDGILLGWQAVGVVAHGVQHVEALQTLIAGIDVGGDVAQRMTHMQTCAAGVGEHVQDIIFGDACIFLHTVGALFGPKTVPLLFNLAEIVFFCHNKM